MYFSVSNITVLLSNLVHAYGALSPSRDLLILPPQDAGARQPQYLLDRIEGGPGGSIWDATGTAAALEPHCSWLSPAASPSIDALGFIAELC